MPLFYLQSLQLFTNVVMEAAGIDYHVMLAANAFQQCLDIPELQPELLCALIKQTSRLLAPSGTTATGAASNTSGKGGGGSGVQVKKHQHGIKHPKVSLRFLFLFELLASPY